MNQKKLSPSAWTVHVELEGDRLTLADQGAQTCAKGTLTLTQVDHPLGYRVRVEFLPNQASVIKSCHLETPWQGDAADWLLCNGWWRLV